MSEQGLAAPQSAVLAQACAVPGEDQPVTGKGEFSGECRSVGAVVKNPRERETPARGEARGRVSGVGVADDSLGADAV